MDIREIEALAMQFRQGAYRAWQAGEFTGQQPFNNFPDACCGDMTDLLAQYLLRYCTQEIRCFYVYGTYWPDDIEDVFSHAWLEIEGRVIVDLTADQRQFKYSPLFKAENTKPCYVGGMNNFYELFETDPNQCRPCVGLRALGEEAYKRLKGLYDIIVRYIE